jgi:dUTP pyrophosphatase
MRIAKRTSEPITLPYRKYEMDAGIDLCAYGDYEIQPFDYLIIKTEIFIELPKNTMGWITNKSRNNFLIGAGVVDEGYQGELLIKVFNPTKYPIKIQHGQPVAQLIILPILKPDLEWVRFEDLYQNKSERGRTGGISNNLYKVQTDFGLVDVEVIKENGDGTVWVRALSGHPFSGWLTDKNLGGSVKESNDTFWFSEAKISKGKLIES